MDFSSKMNNNGIGMGAMGDGIVEFDCELDSMDDYIVSHFTDLDNADAVLSSSSIASQVGAQDTYDGEWVTRMNPGISSSSEEPSSLQFPENSSFTNPRYLGECQSEINHLEDANTQNNKDKKENEQHLQEVVGNPVGAYQPTETISYINLYSPGIENSQYQVTKCSLNFNEANAPPPSPQEVSSSVPKTAAESHDARHKSSGCKTKPRKTELKVKLYERKEPMSDPNEEKKRQKAIRAKEYRNKQNIKLQDLESRVKLLTAERDTLQATNTKLINKCDAFENISRLFASTSMCQ
ncbi:unnamed protein product [Meganyctiphanes norvegica]|uniref:BZIP domain-containing protein n=1 Tax=Meganyctiphanes norvegica TaxID=48144 RepID=A0AAV2QV77_MEGNR